MLEKFFFFFSKKKPFLINRVYEMHSTKPRLCFRLLFFFNIRSGGKKKKKISITFAAAAEGEQNQWQERMY